MWHGVVVLLAFAAHGAIWTSMNFPDHHGFQLLYDFVSLPNEEVAPVGGFVLVMVMVALALTAAADAFLSTKKGTTRTRIDGWRRKDPRVVVVVVFFDPFSCWPLALGWVVLVSWR